VGAPGAIGAAPLAAPTVDTTAPPGGYVPPPVPDGTTTYSYTPLAGPRPLGALGLAGGGPLTVYPGSGIVLVPAPEVGVMRAMVWWPDTTDVLVYRVTPDGARTPVRGGYSLRIDAPTRRNYATNPSVETALTGWSAADGTPTLSQRTLTEPAVGTLGSTVLRAAVASAGSIGVGVPHALPVSPEATIGFALLLSARATSVTVSVTYLDRTGAALTPVTATLTADRINASVETWARQAVTVRAAAGAITVSTIKVVAGGMPAGGYLEVDAVTVEQGRTDGTEYDGSVLGGSWTGAAQLSVSRLAPVVTLEDGEAPLDVPLVYEVGNYASAGGGLIRSAAATLDSGGRTWLTHPTAAAAPVSIDLRAVPDRVHEIEQGVFRVLGRRFPIVVTGAERQAPAGTIAINAISATERNQLLALFQDGQPVLIRTPSDYHLGTAGSWYSLGTISEDREGRKAWQDAFLLTAPYYEVDVPDPALTA